MSNKIGKNRSYYELAKGYLKGFATTEGFDPSFYFEVNKTNLMVRYIVSTWFACRRHDKNTPLQEAHIGIIFLSMFPGYFRKVLMVMETIKKIDRYYHEDPDKEEVFKHLQVVVKVLEKEDNVEKQQSKENTDQT